ncbi:hypothetical protein A2U01_0099630, partial [Trifolium medium]|nr:hypothetical protein [Trifolium medium]
VDAVFGHMPVTAVIAAVFASVYIWFGGQLLWELNVCLLEISTRDSAKIRSLGAFKGGVTSELARWRF